MFYICYYAKKCNSEPPSLLSDKLSFSSDERFPNDSGKTLTETWGMRACVCVCVDGQICHRKKRGVEENTRVRVETNSITKFSITRKLITILEKSVAEIISQSQNLKNTHTQRFRITF